MGQNVKFAVFADFHYKFGMYTASVEDLQTILDRAHNENTDFTIHCGDFCNDYTGSPELWKAYLYNSYGQKVYGIYGNHELEADKNSMAYVTPKLTNDDNVVWGTKSGKIEDGSCGYYHFDLNGFRFICTDNNYSYSEARDCWEHNATCSWGPPQGNITAFSMGPEQLKWFERVIFDAAEKGLKCIVFGHDSYSAIWSSSPDTPKVQEIYNAANAKRKGTVLMSINGHHHTLCGTGKKGDVLYFDVGSALNGLWLPQGNEHYTQDQTFTQTEYDDCGNPIAVREVPMSAAWMSPNTWFYESPLSAIITVSDNGDISINGSKTRWIHNVLPENQMANPEILSIEYKGEL